MATATDEQLRKLARSLAGRIAVAVAAGGAHHDSGVGRLTRLSAARGEGEVDLDASLDSVIGSRLTSTAPALDELVISSWRRPTTALCLLVDRSGSMIGPRLAAAAVAAAAVLFREGTDCSVIAFSDDAIVLKAQGERRSTEAVVADLLSLRGFGVTDLALAMRAARLQLDSSNATRRVAVLLSDCRVTTGGDATIDAASLPEVAVLAPEGDSEDARTFAEAVGARWTTIDGPSGVPEAFELLLACADGRPIPRSSTPSTPTDLRG